MEDGHSNKTKMNGLRLHEHIRPLSELPLPKLPPNFSAQVWSKIDSRETAWRSEQPLWLQTLSSILGAPQWVAAALALALLVGWSLGRNATNGVAIAPETRMTASVTGEVIDMSCYFDDGASGPEHAACARRCITSGLPVGLKATDGKIYLLIGQQEPPSHRVAPKRESLNAQLALYAAKVVTVRGTIIRKQGVNVIEDARVISI